MENKTVNNRYVAKRLRLVSYLRDNGYLPYGQSVDFNNPKYLVYFYDRDVEGFEKCLNTYFEQFKK